MSEYLWVDEPWMSEPKTFNSNSANWEYHAPTHPYIISTLPETYRKETWEQLKREEERSRRLAERDMTWEIPRETLKDIADSMRPKSLDPMAIITPDMAETYCRQHAQGDHQMVRMTLCPLCYEEAQIPPF